MYQPCHQIEGDTLRRIPCTRYQRSETPSLQHFPYARRLTVVATNHIRFGGPEANRSFLPRYPPIQRNDYHLSFPQAELILRHWRLLGRSDCARSPRLVCASLHRYKDRRLHRLLDALLRAFRSKVRASSSPGDFACHCVFSQPPPIDTQPRGSFGAAISLSRVLGPFLSCSRRRSFLSFPIPLSSPLCSRSLSRGIGFDRTLAESRFNCEITLTDPTWKIRTRFRHDIFTIIKTDQRPGLSTISSTSTTIFVPGHTHSLSSPANIET